MVSKVLLAAIVMMGFVAAPRPVRAEESSHCTTDLYDCYVSAAKIDDFWRRWAAGIDCELDYAGCVRDLLLEE